MSHERTMHNSLDDIVEADLNKKAQEHNEYVNLLMGIDGADEATLSAMSTQQLVSLADKYTADEATVTAEDLGIAKPSITTPSVENAVPQAIEPESMNMRSRLKLTYTGVLNRIITQQQDGLESGKKKLDNAKEAFKKRHFGRGFALGAVGVASTLGVAGSAAVITKFLNTEADFFNVFDAEAAQADTGDETGEDPTPAGPPTPEDEDTDYLESESHKGDRMSTEGMFDSDSKERSNLEADRHVLEKIKNNPSLAAAVLEVRESGRMDETFSVEDVNKNTKAFSVSGEHGEYSDKGQKAIETLEKSWKGGEIGSLLSEEEVREMEQKYDLINHGTDEGEFKNAIDDTTYNAGIFDYRPDLGDMIYEKELGNGHKVLTIVNERDPSRDCLNIITLSEKGAYNPVESFTNPKQSQGGSEPQPQDSFTSNPNTTYEDGIEVGNSVENLPLEEDEPVGDQPGEIPQEEVPPQTPPETPNNPKIPSQDINASPHTPEQVQIGNDPPVPAGEQLPATQPPEEYQEPAAPEPEPEPRPTPPPPPEAAAPTPAAPATGTVDPKQT